MESLLESKSDPLLAVICYWQVDCTFLLSLFLSLLVSLKLEHYTRECEFGNFDKIKKQKQHKKQNNTKTSG